MCDFKTKSIIGRGYNFLDLGSTSVECANTLYEKLREGEKVADIIIAFELSFKDEIADSVMNRLVKACGKGLYSYSHRHTFYILHSPSYQSDNRRCQAEK